MKSITVQELTKILSQYPADTEVVIDGDPIQEGNLWRSYSRSIRKVRFRPVKDGKIPQRPTKESSTGELKVILY